MAEFTTAFGQDGPEATRPSSAMFLTACAVCAKALNNDEATVKSYSGHTGIPTAPTRFTS